MRKFHKVDAPISRKPYFNPLFAACSSLLLPDALLSQPLSGLKPRVSHLLTAERHRFPL